MSLISDMLGLPDDEFVITGETAELMLKEYRENYGEPPIQCGDAAELLKNFKDESVDLVVTSPPYDDLRHYNNTLGEWNHEVFMTIATELARVIKPGGVIVWNVADKVENGSLTCTSMKQALFFRDLGLNLNENIIWQKLNPMPVVRTTRHTPCYENMFVFSKGKPKTFNPVMRPCKSAGKKYDSTAKVIGGEKGRKRLTYNVNKEMVDYNIWGMAVAQNKYVYTNKEGKEIKHPAVFPIELPLRHIQTWTNEGDVVLDPFAGSGTTLLAAKQLKRKYIGIEKNEDYYRMIIQRLKEFRN